MMLARLGFSLACLHRNTLSGRPTLLVMEVGMLVLSTEDNCLLSLE